MNFCLLVCQFILSKFLQVFRCSCSGQRIYRNPKFNFDLAEYIPANINSASDNSTANSAIYDLGGRKLTEKPQKGFYIQGGCKYIAR